MSSSTRVGLEDHDGRKEGMMVMHVSAHGPARGSSANALCRKDRGRDMPEEKSGGGEKEGGALVNPKGKE